MLLVLLSTSSHALPCRSPHLPLFPRPNAPRASPLMVRDDLPAPLRAEACDDDILIGTIEPGDLPRCIDILMEAFYKDILTLAADEFSEEELALIMPTLSKLNGIFTWFTRLSITLDTKRRIGRRMLSGGTALSGRSSVFLGLQHQPSGRILAVVDLSEQPKDGKVPGDVRLPRWATREIPDVAYVACLAVTSESRGMGYGGRMLRACEGIAKLEWGYSEIHLHATSSDDKLLNMYSHLGYEQLPSFDQPQWVLNLSGREATRFHRRGLA